MDLDELKQAWQSQSARLDRLEQQNRTLRQRVCGNSILSKRSKLMRTYLILIAVTAIMIPFVLVAFPKIHLSGLSMALFVLVFVVLGAMNTYVYFLIKRIDITSLTMQEALRMVLHLEKVRHNIRLFSIPFTLAIVGYFMYDLYELGETHVIIGGIVGGVIGGIIGLRKEMEIKATIRAMKADLEDAQREE